MPSNWEGALGSPGGCEMQGFCQGSSSCEMGTWGWRKGAFKGTKRWKNPNLCSGSSALAALPSHKWTRPPGRVWLCPVSFQSCRDMGTLVGLPNSLLVVSCCALVRAVLYNLWKVLVLGGGCCIPFLCHPQCPRLCEWGLWPKSSPLPTAE